MLNKAIFLGKIYLYKLQLLFGLKRIDIMSVINDYYREDFRRLKSRDIAVILPHCLIADKCPAKFSKSDGILCNSCNLCGCGEILKTATRKGYQFYITPSVGFTKRLVQRKQILGVIGITCDYEIERGIRTEKISDRGIVVNSRKVKTQGIRLHAYDCINNSVDWEKIQDLIL